MNMYGSKAEQEIDKAMHEYKPGDVFKNRRQAMAIGLAKARKEGGRIPAARHMQHK